MEHESYFGYAPEEYGELERRMHIIGQQSDHLAQDPAHAHHRPRYEGVGGFQEQMEKQKVIDERCEKSRLAFESYFAEGDAPVQSFEGIPKEVLEYLIPKRLLEIMPDPEKVDIIPVRADEERLAVYIAARDHFPHRTIDDMRAAHAQGWDALRQEGDQDNYYRVKMLGHEYMPVIYHPDSISPHDMVCMNSELETCPSPDVVYYSSYLDHEQVRGRGVTAEYRARLEALLAKLGFAYLTADLEHTYDRYYRKQGYLPLESAEPALRARLLPHRRSVRITPSFCYKRLAPPEQDDAGIRV